jgi:Zn-dependent peptidase ImmA (M78 family)
LLEHFNIESVAVPEEIVTDLPRIKIELEYGLTVSGAAHWNGHYWVITLSAEDHRFRQRFSLMHEFKHIIDHTTKGFLYADASTLGGCGQAERVADHFAACVLMPKRVVKRLWGQGHQDPRQLAALLQVSPSALRYRLIVLGLSERRARCRHRDSQTAASHSAKAAHVTQRCRPLWTLRTGGTP